MTNIDIEISTKIKIASFLCTIMVLYRHSLNYLAFFDTWNGFGINKYVQGSISVLTEIAVPYFFIISGVFFLNKNYYSSSYFIMIKKKFKTLIIPFLFWNIICLVPILIFEKDIIFSEKACYIKDIFMSNWNAPLWYIRDLVLIMLFVPLYNWIFLINRWWIYLLFALPLFYLWIPIDTGLLSSEGLLYFFIGGIISRKQNLLSYKINNKALIIITILWILLSIGVIPIPNIYIHKLNTIIGIISFWNILNYIPNKDRTLPIAQFSFIIYAMHSYPIKIFKNGIAIFFKGNEVVALITYIITPIVIVTLIVVIAKFWKVYSNKTYNFVTGNR